MDNFANEIFDMISKSEQTAPERYKNILDGLSKLEKKGASIVDPACVEKWNAVINSMRGAKHFTEINLCDNEYGKLKATLNVIEATKRGLPLENIDNYLMNTDASDKIIDRVKVFSPSAYAQLEKMLADRPKAKSGRGIGGESLNWAVEKSKQNPPYSGDGIIKL